MPRILALFRPDPISHTLRKAQIMTEESKTIEKLTTTAKAALLEAITGAASKGERGAAVLETLARAYASVASNGPVKGELTD